MERRSFLESLAGLTSGLMLSGSDVLEGNLKSDRFGELLPQRKLGKTGETVTMLGAGGAHIGRMNERDAQATIEAAIEGGVRFFDTAESYRDGRSERYYGRFLVPKYRDEVFLMTKTTARDAETARQHLEGSLKRLNTDYLDLWQMHSVQSPRDVELRLQNGVVDVIKEAKANGKVRHIGFTGHRMPSGHQQVLDRTEAFETCQMPINVTDPNYKSFIKGVLPTLVERNYGVLAMKTLADGGFFEGSSSVVPDYVSIREALHFVWSLPVSVLITGAENVEQMKEKIDLARSFERMSEEERKALVRKVADLENAEFEWYKA